MTAPVGRLPSPHRRYCDSRRPRPGYPRLVLRQPESSRSAQLGAVALLVVLITVGVGVPFSAAAQFTRFEAAIARFDADVAAGVANDAAGFASVAVFIGSEVVWAKGWGWADIEHRVAATASTIGRTGSISKSITAVVMMQLRERGLLDLDDPVSVHLPAIEQLAGLPVGALPITLRMLASHTAGLIREPDLENAAAGSIYRWEQKVLESIPHTTVATLPGTEYSYSNIGFGIVGLAISRTARVPFMELVETQIFRPLGMSSSTFVVEQPEIAARLAVGYDRDPVTGEISAELATREHFGRGYKVPNGGVYSTVHDLARFAAAMMGVAPVAILSAESRAEMLAPQPPATDYGLGFDVLTGDGITIVGHPGGVAGYNADLAFDLESMIGVAMLRTTTYEPPVRDLLERLVQTGRDQR